MGRDDFAKKRRKREKRSRKSVTVVEGTRCIDNQVVSSRFPKPPVGDVANRVHALVE